jgi:F-type H+-transporting ATPase subunit b
MPQIAQLAEVAYSQFFWLLLVLALIYFGIGRAMLPKIQSTVDARDSRIKDDLIAAERAKADADATEEAYRLRMDASRAEALKVTQAAKQATAREGEERVRAADAEIGEASAAAETRLRAATQATLADIEDVAAEAVEQIVAKLAGLTVGRAKAAQAVKAAMADV